MCSRTNRRAVVLGLGGVAVTGLAHAHTPYGQWVVYRKKHLLIGSHRGDLKTYDLAKAVVAALARELPEAKARVARGPRPQRIATLMGTGQLMVSVLSDAEAQQMAERTGPFADYPAVRLTTLVAFGAGYALFAHPDMPQDHASLVVDALGRSAMEISHPGRILHPGAEHFWAARDH